MNIRAGFVLSVVVTGGVFAGGCGSWTTQDRGHGCNVGSTRPEAPIVCIDNTRSRLSVDPFRVVAYDEYPRNSGRPMVILFFTKTGTGNFKVVEKKGNCIADQDCVEGAGLCRVTVADVKDDERERLCEYDIEMPGFPPMDPEMLIKTCC